MRNQPGRHLPRLAGPPLMLLDPRLCFWTLAYAFGPLLMLLEALNGDIGASNGLFRPCFSQKLPFECLLEPRMVITVQKSVISDPHEWLPEHNDASKSIREAPGSIIEGPGRLTMVSGSINEAPRRIREAPRSITKASGRISKAPGRLTMAPGRLTMASRSSIRGHQRVLTT